MANGVWAASVLAQAKLVGAKFGERRPRERALNAVTNHYQCKEYETARSVPVPAQ